MNVQTPYTQLIEYPFGSGNLFDIPMEQTEVETSGMSLQFIDSNGNTLEAIVPADCQVWGRLNSQAKDMWLSIDSLLFWYQYHAVYIDLGVLFNVDVSGVAITGEKAEEVPVQYHIAMTHRMRLHAISTGGSSGVHSVQPVWRGTPTDVGCPCLFTNDPSCGKKLLYTLEKLV